MFERLQGPATAYVPSGHDSPQRGWIIVPPAALLKFNIKAEHEYGRQPNLRGMRFPAPLRVKPGMAQTDSRGAASIYTAADGYMNLRAPRATWNALAPGRRFSPRLAGNIE